MANVLKKVFDNQRKDLKKFDKTAKQVETLRIVLQIIQMTN